MDHLKNATTIANILDNQFSIAGIRFGLSAFIGMVPGIGDAIDALLSLYLVWIGVQMGMPFYRIGQMLWNIGINFLIGLVPVVGDATYILRRANMKNLKILQKFASTKGINYA